MPASPMPTICIVTAGVPRKPGMSRDDLLGINLKVMKAVGEGHQRSTLPTPSSSASPTRSDAMVWALREFSGLPHKKVVGMAGVLDSGPLRLLPQRKDRRLGRGHSCLDARRSRRRTLVPMVRHSTIGGLPLPECVAQGWFTQDELDAIVTRTRGGGGGNRRPAQDGLGLLRAGGIGYRHGDVVPQGQEARSAGRRLPQRRIRPCAGLYVGVPVVIGKDGAERIIQFSVNDAEKAMFAKSVESVRGLSPPARPSTLHWLKPLRWAAKLRLSALRCSKDGLFASPARLKALKSTKKPSVKTGGFFVGLVAWQV